MSLPHCAVAVIPDRSHVHVVATGELDLSTTPLLRRELDDIVSVGWLDVTADLREAAFADSSTLHALLDAHDKLTDAGGALTVLVEPGPITDLLALTATDRVLSVTEAAARR